MVAKLRWQSSDLALLPDDGKRYEIVDGELLVTRAPHSRHQDVCGEIFYYIKAWLKAEGSGKVWFGPGIVFTDFDNVIPDVAWVSQARPPIAQDDGGHLLEAPDLAVEVLSAGQKDIDRDRKLKLRLYSVQGVKEYWLVDWRAKKVEIYRRDSGQLVLTASLFEGDVLTSPLMPQFSCLVDLLFAA
ncbi:Uma2 family endonuclease [cf. Phormidesmis sp. LEGE 11477]|uniref:Uma2 family endonuclease n=1 Tax=cf. Phormidesmis sp. LEGE 11477 TaxID=1828680 RepID=UPI00187F7087|nr:Uma2 family endonuclease [cf. Phormidesmis sp. LEGE 11477]MBE9064684.1 Uma2 family endonuclease [cf. Phormidesmis sp. LEGE 11477]